MNIYAFFTLCVILIAAGAGLLAFSLVMLIKRIDSNIREKRKKMRRAAKKEAKTCRPK